MGSTPHMYPVHKGTLTHRVPTCTLVSIGYPMEHITVGSSVLGVPYGAGYCGE